MTRIYFTGIDATTTENEYTMTEISAADHGEEWNGDTLGYIQNLDLDSDYTVGSENDLGNVHQNFGGLDPVPGSIIVLLQDDVPVLVYWASEVTASWLPGKKTVYEVYNLYVEVKKTAPALTAEDAHDALVNAFMDDEKPVATFDSESDAAAYIAAQGPGSIEDFGHYWRVHGWISYEVDVTTDEDGDVTDWESCGVTGVSEF